MKDGFLMARCVPRFDPMNSRKYHQKKFISKSSMISVIRMIKRNVVENILLWVEINVCVWLQLKDTRGSFPEVKKSNRDCEPIFFGINILIKLPGKSPRLLSIVTFWRNVVETRGKR
jgi:hypothetical protein